MATPALQQSPPPTASPKPQPQFWLPHGSPQTATKHNCYDNTKDLLPSFQGIPPDEITTQKPGETNGDYGKRLVKYSSDYFCPAIVETLKTHAATVDSDTNSATVTDLDRVALPYLRDLLHWEIIVQSICAYLAKTLKCTGISENEYQKIRGILLAYRKKYGDIDYLYRCFILKGDMSDEELSYYNEVITLCLSGCKNRDNSLVFNEGEQQYLERKKHLEELIPTINQRDKQQREIAQKHASDPDRLNWANSVKQVKTDEYKKLTDDDIRQFICFLFPDEWGTKNYPEVRCYNIPNSDIYVVALTTKQQIDELSQKKEMQNKIIISPENQGDYHWVLYVSNLENPVDLPGNGGWACGYLTILALAQQLRQCDVVKEFDDAKQELIKKILETAKLDYFDYGQRNINLRNIIVQFLLESAKVDRALWPNFLLPQTVMLAPTSQTSISHGAQQVPQQPQQISQSLLPSTSAGEQQKTDPLSGNSELKSIAQQEQCVSAKNPVSTVLPAKVAVADISSSIIILAQSSSIHTPPPATSPPHKCYFRVIRESLNAGASDTISDSPSIDKINKLIKKSKEGFRRNLINSLKSHFDNLDKRTNQEEKEVSREKLYEQRNEVRWELVVQCICFYLLNVASEIYKCKSLHESTYKAIREALDQCLDSEHYNQDYFYHCLMSEATSDNGAYYANVIKIFANTCTNLDKELNFDQRDATSSLRINQKTHTSKPRPANTLTQRQITTSSTVSPQSLLSAPQLSLSLFKHTSNVLPKLVPSTSDEGPPVAKKPNHHQIRHYLHPLHLLHQL